MLGHDEIDRVIDRDVYDEDGDKIGAARQVYLDDDTGRPAWITVRTGLLGTRSSFVPLADARLTDRGLTVPYGKAFVKDAPNLDDDGHLTPEEERDLYAYYFSSRSEKPEGTEHRDDSGREPDDATPVGEERTGADPGERENGRVRLRKYVITEYVDDHPSRTVNPDQGDAR